jgi:hypothetical protein
MASVRKTSQVLLAHFLPQHADLIEPSAMGDELQLQMHRPVEDWLQGEGLAGSASVT